MCSPVPQSSRAVRRRRPPSLHCHNTLAEICSKQVSIDSKKHTLLWYVCIKFFKMVGFEGFCLISWSERQNCQDYCVGHLNLFMKSKLQNSYRFMFFFATLKRFFFVRAQFCKLRDTPKLTHGHQLLCCNHNKLCYDHKSDPSWKLFLYLPKWFLSVLSNPH